MLAAKPLACKNPTYLARHSQEKTNILAPELLTPDFHVFAMLLVTIRTAMPPQKLFRQVSGTEFQYKSV